MRLFLAEGQGLGLAGGILDTELARCGARAWPHSSSASPSAYTCVDVPLVCGLAMALAAIAAQHPCRSRRRFNPRGFEGRIGRTGSAGCAERSSRLENVEPALRHPPSLCILRFAFDLDLLLRPVISLGPIRNETRLVLHRNRGFDQTYGASLDALHHVSFRVEKGE